MTTQTTPPTIPTNIPPLPAGIPPLPTSATTSATTSVTQTTTSPALATSPAIPTTSAQTPQPPLLPPQNPFLTQNNPTPTPEPPLFSPAELGNSNPPPLPNPTPTEGATPPLPTLKTQISGIDIATGEPAAVEVTWANVDLLGSTVVRLDAFIALCREYIGIMAGLDDKAQFTPVFEYVTEESHHALVKLLRSVPFTVPTADVPTVRGAVMNIMKVAGTPDTLAGWVEKVEGVIAPFKEIADRELIAEGESDKVKEERRIQNRKNVARYRARQKSGISANYKFEDEADRLEFERARDAYALGLMNAKAEKARLEEAKHEELAVVRARCAALKKAVDDKLDLLEVELDMAKKKGKRSVK